MGRRWTIALAVALLAVTPIVVAAQNTLTWTGGAVGGGWDTISSGVAALLREKADLAVRVIPGGGAQNPVLVERGDAQIGLGLPPLLGAAARGEDPYRGKTLGGLRAIAGNMSVNVLHFYLAADSPFANMTLEEIFRGRKPIRLAIPKPGTSVSIRKIAPTTNAITPPIPSEPKLGKNTSAIMKLRPSTMSARPV